MRSSEGYPQREVQGNVTGINSLPGYGADSGGGIMPDDYAPLTPQNNFVPTAPAVSIPRAMPVAPQDDWRNSSASYRTNYPAPGTQYPVPGTPYGGPPAMQPPSPGFFGGISSFFSNLVSGAGNAGQDVIGGLGGLLRGINFNPSGGGGPAQPMRSPQPMGRPSFGGTSFQSFFPGSNIGPTSGRITNPYSSSGPGARQPLGGPPPAFARAFTSQVQSRNIA